MTTLSKLGPGAEFIGAGDDVFMLDTLTLGVLVDADDDGRATVRVGDEWIDYPFDRLAHPDSPQADAASMFTEETEVRR